jgi:hypothetical protein
LRSDERAEREPVVPEGAVQEVQIEGRDAEAEGAESGGADIEERVAGAEAGRLGQGARPRVTSTVCVCPSRMSASFTRSPGRVFSISVLSGCSWSIC